VQRNRALTERGGAGEKPAAACVALPEGLSIVVEMSRVTAWGDRMESRRRDGHPIAAGEVVEYQRARAALLTRIAARGRIESAVGLAAAARAELAELEAGLAAAPLCSDPFPAQGGRSRAAVLPTSITPGRYVAAHLRSAVTTYEEKRDGR
jgi:hypothetical protein